MKVRYKPRSRSRLSNFIFFTIFDNGIVQLVYRTGGACRLMVYLLAVNMFPILYISFSDPNQWIKPRPRRESTDQVPPKEHHSGQLGQFQQTHQTMGERLILFMDFPPYYELEGAQGPHGLARCNSRSPFRHRIKCELTVDKKLFNRSDAVVFFSHYKKEMSHFDFKPIKLPGQTWTFFSVESPIFSANKAFGDAAFHKKFNSTMTYRTDSEFNHAYIRAERRLVPLSKQEIKREEMEVRLAFRNKTKMAAIFVSHCNAPSGRDTYIHHLKRYMEIDVYGKCGPLKCEDRDLCDKMLAWDYKFYLAFENSNCVDYITEKLYKIMRMRRVVPIVRGGADYSKLLPENSVVDTSRFFSPWELAHHLTALAQDEDEWVRMFQWHTSWEVVVPQLPLCQYCYHLFKHKRNSRLYDNVYDWWKKGSCFPPNDL